MPADPKPYQTPAWRKLRREKLLESPLCEACRMARSEQVDHIKPWRGDWDLFLDPDNLRALCHSCHSAKTVARDGGFGNPKRDGPLKGTGPDGWPLDPEHRWNG